MIEICLQRELSFSEGDLLNYKIAGTEVGCVFSVDTNKWTVPPEMEGQVCLLVWVDETATLWSMGVMRAIEGRLSRDPEGKTFLNKAGRRAILWLFQKEPLTVDDE